MFSFEQTPVVELIKKSPLKVYYFEYHTSPSYMVTISIAF